MIVAHTKADRATADQSILKRLAQLYEDGHDPSASITTSTHAHMRQQETMVQQLKHKATTAVAAVDAAIAHSSPATTPGKPAPQLYRDALLACTTANRARADLLTAQLCASNQCEVGGRPVILTCVQDVYQHKLGWYEQLLQQR